MLWVIRFILLVLILFIIYQFFLYLFDPTRKLKLACQQQRYYFYDDPTNIRKNFFLTYKGIIFEGEKYSETVNPPFDVVSISIAPQLVIDLDHFSPSDFYHIEQQIYEHYPHATINWRTSVK